MDATCKQFLAGAAGPKKHHRNVRVGHALDGARHFQHLRSGRHHSTEHARVGCRRHCKTHIVRFYGMEVKGPAHDHPQFVYIDRLLVKVIGTTCDRPHSALARTMP